jgi:Amt family ammonium transporter
VPTAAKSTDSIHQTIILWVMHFIPPLCLRCSEETEIIGVDDGEMGEFAYDYVGIEIELGPRHMYSGDVGATGGGREPMHHEMKTSIASEHRSDAESQYPLNHFPMKAIRG